MDFQCPHCGFSYELSPEYLADYGDAETNCTECGKPFQLPSAVQSPIPVQSDSVTLTLSYAAPPLVAAPEPSAWQDQGFVVYIRGKSLPRRCPKCDQPAIGRGTWLRMSFQQSGFRWPVGAIGLAAVAINAIAAEETMLRVYFCPRHHRRYHTGIMLGWLLPLCGICTILAAAVMGSHYFAPLLVLILCLSGMLAIPAGIIWAKTVRKGISVVAADKRFAWIDGCCEEFVESLPDYRLVLEAQSLAAAENLRRIDGS